PDSAAPRARATSDRFDADSVFNVDIENIANASVENSNRNSIARTAVKPRRRIELGRFMETSMFQPHPVGAINLLRRGARERSKQHTHLNPHGRAVGDGLGQN